MLTHLHSRWFICFPKLRFSDQRKTPQWQTGLCPNKKRATINLSTYNCPDAVLGLIELLLEHHKPYFTKLPCHQQISIEIMAFVYILLFLVIYHLVVYLLMIYLKYQLFLVSYSLSLSNQAMDYHLRFAESQ